MAQSRIRWISKVNVEFVGPDDVNVRPLQTGEIIGLDRSALGGSIDFLLSIQVYAPGLTDQVKSHLYVDQFVIAQETIDALDLVVESGLIIGNRRFLTAGSLIAGRRGGSFIGGWDNNDLLAYWSLRDPENTGCVPGDPYRPMPLKPGAHQIEVKAEGNVLGSLTLQLV